MFALALAAAISFPEPSPETRPWGICHLLGSAAETGELSREMRRWREGGLGGVRVVPIYGANGYEDKYVEFMSPRFVSILKDFNRLSRENGMKFDLSFGAGWCFGGKSVPPELGVQALKTVKDGDAMPRRAKVLWKGNGAKLVAYLTGQGIKRAQKADAGPMLNPFSPAALEAHVSQFAPLDGAADALPRATFHDSFEYVRASWSDEFPAFFRKYRGYAIEDHYAELAGCGDPDAVARVKCDYRETLNDILVRETFPVWTRWCRERGILTHNQAHGAPANLLEFYAVSDTPETEMFGRGARDRFKSGFDARFREGMRNPLVSKFASSAAHLAGRKHASAESFTWLSEHFCETPEEIKALGDLLFLSGINRLYYHATVYSPDSAPWPGWCFYAASELNPRNPLWRDMRPLNDYFARVQTLLADAAPDNDVLLYWPVYDRWMDPGGFAPGFGVEPKWLERSAFGRLAKRLWNAGYSFDYVSDSFLGDDVVSRYKAIVVPETRYMKRATFERLVALSAKMPVMFEKRLPESGPGLAGAALDVESAPAPVRDAVSALGGTAARRDAFAAGESPFDCVRLKWKGGRLYFAVNASVGPASLVLPSGAVAMDPMDGGTRRVEGGKDCSVEMSPAESLFVWLADGEIAAGKSQGGASGDAVALGNWRLEFVKDVSGWKLPPPREGDVLGDWTRFGSAEEEFSGTARYTASFEASGLDAGCKYVLDLGEVRTTARVAVNGECTGVAFMHPYSVEIPGRLVKAGTNTLEIEVSNLGANRIRAYDRKGVKWKTFGNANVMGFMTGRLLHAENWPVMPSGLAGPVRLEKTRPNAVSTDRGR